MVGFLCGRSVFRVIYLFYCFAWKIRVSLCVGVWQHDRVEIIANVPLHSRFPPSFPHSTPFPHWISQNEIIKVTDNNYRPDLTKAALARLSAVNRSLKVAKSGAKKWNMQAPKKAWRSSSLKLDVDFQPMPISGYGSQLEKLYFKTLEQSVCRDFEVDYGSKEHVVIVFAALDVDKELQPDKVKRQMSISDGRLIVSLGLSPGYHLREYHNPTYRSAQII